MGHKHHKNHSYKKHPKKSPAPDAVIPNNSTAEHLEIVLKTDTDGSREAISAEIEKLSSHRPIAIIHAGIGDINNSDVFLAATADRLVLGFEVGTNQHLLEVIEKSGVEIRLYNVIYRLIEDLKEIIDSFRPVSSKEIITGSAKVIAIFKSTRKGIILGCRVSKGKISKGDTFRVIGAKGPVYSGRIESLHIGNDTVHAAAGGQEVGIKISDFKKAAVNDLIETYIIKSAGPAKPWTPQPRVLHI